MSTTSSPLRRTFTFLGFSSLDFAKITNLKLFQEAMCSYFRELIGGINVVLIYQQCILDVTVQVLQYCCMEYWIVIGESVCVTMQSKTRKWLTGHHNSVYRSRLDVRDKPCPGLIRLVLFVSDEIHSQQNRPVHEHPFSSLFGDDSPSSAVNPGW